MFVDVVSFSCRAIRVFEDLSEDVLEMDGNVSVFCRRTRAEDGGRKGGGRQAKAGRGDEAVSIAIVIVIEGKKKRCDCQAATRRFATVPGGNDVAMNGGIQYHRPVRQMNCIPVINEHRCVDCLC